MIKLYKSVDGNVYYWETWEEDKKSSTVHWGKLGTTGESELLKTDRNASVTAKVQQLLDEKRQNGYNEIAFEDHYTLLIEYKVEGMGTKADVAKRHELEDRMNETLGWTGLGHCDGGSIGSGTMEVCCFVVDFELAKRIIEEDLRNTKFSDYTRIYDENE